MFCDRKSSAFLKDQIYVLSLSVPEKMIIFTQNIMIIILKTARAKIHSFDSESTNINKENGFLAIDSRKQIHCK